MNEAELKSSELFHLVAETSSWQDIQETAWLLLIAFRQIDSENVEENMEPKDVRTVWGHLFI